jgi:hypothetical protein
VTLLILTTQIGKAITSPFGLKNVTLVFISKTNATAPHTFLVQNVNWVRPIFIFDTFLTQKDDCSRRVSFYVYEPWSNLRTRPLDDCPYPPQVLHCNREDIMKKDRLRKFTINGKIFLL